jgi:hypothetical protein
MAIESSHLRLEIRYWIFGVDKSVSRVSNNAGHQGWFVVLSGLFIKKYGLTTCYTLAKM